jgi:hypothetical protein
MAKPIPGWRPTDNVWYVMDDKTGEKRTDEDLQKFLDDLRVTANQHGFDMHFYGTDRSIAKLMEIRKR